MVGAVDSFGQDLDATVIAGMRAMKMPAKRVQAPMPVRYNSARRCVPAFLRRRMHRPVSVRVDHARTDAPSEAVLLELAVDTSDRELQTSLLGARHGRAALLRTAPKKKTSAKKTATKKAAPKKANTAKKTAPAKAAAKK